MTTKKFILALVVLCIAILGIYVVQKKPTAKTQAVLTLRSEKSEEKYTTIDMQYPDIATSTYPEMKAYIESSKADFISNYGSISDADAAEMHMGGDRKYNYVMQTDIATTTQTTSYIISVYEFTGGAHGGTSVTTFTYDADGKLVTLGDLFQGNYLEKISGLARTYFYDKLAESSQKEAIDSGTAPTEQNYASWYLSGNTIVFVFGQYSIGPYVLGIQDFPLDAASVSDILSPKFQFLIKK